MLSDKEIVSALLARDMRVTKQYLYIRYYPLFLSIYNRYYTDCETPEELINEIYLFLLYPNTNTGRCRLEDFSYKCSLPMWLKVVTENYCRQLFAKKMDIAEINYEIGDRFSDNDQSLNIDIQEINASDVETLLRRMPNERYRSIIRLRYLEEKTNEETALLLNMTMPNFYNKHKLAKAQFCEILRKEGLV